MDAGAVVWIIPQPDVAAPRADAMVPDDTPRPRRWIVFTTVGVALLMISIDQTSVGSPRTSDNSS